MLPCTNIAHRRKCKLVRTYLQQNGHLYYIIIIIIMLKQCFDTSDNTSFDTCSGRIHATVVMLCLYMSFEIVSTFCRLITIVTWGSTHINVVFIHVF